MSDRQKVEEGQMDGKSKLETTAVQSSVVKCWCCGTPHQTRGPDDPWDGRMLGYCYECSVSRCDAYPGECPIKNAETPDECRCPGYPCEHVPPPTIHLIDKVGWKLAYTRPVTMAMASELQQAGLWNVAALARKYAVDRPRWWHRFYTSDRQRSLPSSASKDSDAGGGA